MIFVLMSVARRVITALVWLRSDDPSLVLLKSVLFVVVDEEEKLLTRSCWRGSGEVFQTGLSGHFSFQTIPPHVQ